MPDYRVLDPVLTDALDSFAAKTSDYSVLGPYVAGLRRTSVSDGADVSALVRVMSSAWRWTAAMPWEDRAATEGLLEATNALDDPDHARPDGIRLTLP